MSLESLVTHMPEPMVPVQIGTDWYIRTSTRIFVLRLNQETCLPVWALVGHF